MARKSDIRLRRSAVSGSVPGGADLNLGELALNTADGAIFVKNGAGNIVTVSHDGILHYDEPNSRIGIGTPTPAVDLHVVSSDGSTIAGAHMNRATLLLGTTTSGMAFDVNEICVAGDHLFLETLGNNDIKFRTNGTQVKMIVKGNGNVGVGYSDPKERFSIGNKINFHDGGHKLIAFGFNPSDSNNATGTGYPADLRYDPSTGDLRFEIDSTQRTNGNASSPSNRLILKAGGDVLVPAGSLGIDASTPYAKLQVNDTVFDGTHGVHADSRVNIASHGSLQAIQYASTYNSADYPDYGMVFVHGPSTSSYNVWSISPDGPAKGDSLNFIYGSNTSNVHTITPKVVFDGNGNVGIGTETPGELLEVAGDTKVTNLGINAGPQDYLSSLSARLTVGGNAVINTDSPILYLRANSTSNNSDLRFQNGLKFTNGSAAIRAIIDGSGNFGVGTDSPERKLHAKSGGQLVVAKFESGNNAGALIDIENDATLASNAGAYAGLRFYNDSGFEMALTHITESSGSGYVQIGTQWASGGEKLVVHSNGNVGIGTTTPAQKLHVSGHQLFENNNELRWKDSGGTERTTLWMDTSNNVNVGASSNAELRFINGPTYSASMTIDVDGKVGIGTSSVNSLLHISHATAPTFRMSRTGTGQVWIQSIDSSGRFHLTEKASEGGTGYTRLKIDDTGEITFNEAYTFPTSIGSSGQILKVPTSGTQLIWANETSSAPLQITDSDGDTKIQVEESADEDIIRFDTAGTQRLVIDASGNVLQAGGDLRFTGGINWDIAHHGAGQNIVFHTTPTGGSATRRMRIDDQGNVGIGTDSMTYKFEVHGNLASSLRARVVNAGNGQSSLDLKTADQETRLIAVNGKSFYVYNQSTNTEPFTILSAGNVGIDFTSPDDRLHVKGGIRTHSASESKYIKILGGNTGNFIDSHGTTLYIRPGGNTGTATTMDASGNVGIGANLTVAGNLTVEGTTTTLNTATLDVEDLNITVAKGAADKAAADGAGITIDCGSDPNATFTYDGGQDRFKFNREIHTSNGIRIEQANPYLILKDTSDDDDHAIRLTASDNTTKYQIDTAGDDFNFRTYGSRGINLLTGDVKRLHVADGGNVLFYAVGGVNARMKWDATNEKLLLGAGDRLSLSTAVSINPSNGTQKVYSLVSSDISSENLAFAMEGNDATDRMSFFTDYNSSGTYDERMSIIAETGRVGINQSVPAAQFHVYSNTTSAPAMLIRNDNASAGGRGLLIQHDNGGAGTDRYALKVVTAFGSSNVNALVVDGNSYVGIGTDQPSEKLHVAGKILAGGQIRSSSYLEDYPSFSFANDTDTGMFSDTADQLEFSTGGSSRVTINSSGNVGIGYTSPGARLHVRSGSDDLVSIFESTDNKSYIAIKDDDTTGYIGAENGKLSLGGQGGANSANLNIDVSTGNVGIGIATANYKLHVVESTENAGAINVTDGTSWMRMVPNLGGSGFNPMSTAGDMGIIFSTDNASGSDTTGGLVIAPHSNNKSGIKIRENGNIGLGTHAPSARLHVNGWANNASNLSTSASNAKVRFQNSDSSSLSSYEGYTGNSWYQQIANGAGTTSYKLSLNPYGGNVGIGTTNPSQKLHVAGTTRLNAFNHKNGLFSPITSASGDNYIGTLDTGSNGDGGGGTLVVYDGHSKNTRVIDIAIRNGSGTSTVTCSVTGSGGGADVDIQLRYVERSNDASKIDFFLASSGGKSFTQYYYWTTSHYVDDSGSSPSSTGATTVDLDDAIGVFTKQNGNVGVGETNPQDKLHVDGTLRVGPVYNPNDRDHIKLVPHGTDTRIISPNERFHIENPDGDILITPGGSGYVGIGNAAPKAKLQVEEYGIDTSSATTTATTQVAIHTFPVADFRSARFTIQITNTTDSTYHSTEILAIHDGSNANITEFGEVHTGSSVEATFDADINSGNFRLLATPTSTNSMTFKVVCHSLTV